MAHLERFNLPRTKCDISVDTMKKLIKTHLVANPYSRIDDWLNLDQEAFVKHFQALYEALATETLRVNEVSLGKAMNSIYKADKHEQEIFTSKFVRSWQHAWMKSKKVSSGAFTSPSLLSLFGCWASKAGGSNAKVQPKLELKTERKTEPKPRSPVKPEPSNEPAGSSGVRWASQSPKGLKREASMATIKTELASPRVKRLAQVPSSPLVPAWSSPKVKWQTSEQARPPTAAEVRTPSAGERLLVIRAIQARLP